MNFLSHYYISHDENDNYYTVGLTAPDLLGFLSRRTRLTRKYLENFSLSESDNNIKSFISGMIVHLELDREFHNSSFFKEKVDFLQEHYKSFNNEKERLPHFYAHIIIEILIDRYLLLVVPNIADDFYESYKQFDFNKIVKIFFDLKDFDAEKFVSFANNVANSSFLREYTSDHLIISILSRVSNRINMPLSLNYTENEFALFIRDSYEKLESSIENYMIKIKRHFNSVA